MSVEVALRDSFVVGVTLIRFVCDTFGDCVYSGESVRVMTPLGLGV